MQTASQRTSYTHEIESAHSHNQQVFSAPVALRSVAAEGPPIRAHGRRSALGQLVWERPPPGLHRWLALVGESACGDASSGKRHRSFVLVAWIMRPQLRRAMAQGGDDEGSNGARTAAHVSSCAHVCASGGHGSQARVPPKPQLALAICGCASMGHDAPAAAVTQWSCGAHVCMESACWLL